MRFVLRVSREVVRWFRTWPHWAKDIYRITTYVNVLELIPTFAAIALVPRHFFRRMPAVLRGQMPIYRTPVKFFASSVILFVVAFFFRHRDLTATVDAQHAVWYMLLLIPLTPVLMIALALLLWLACQLPRAIPHQRPSPSRILIPSGLFCFRTPTRAWTGVDSFGDCFTSVSTLSLRGRLPSSSLDTAWLRWPRW